MPTVLDRLDALQREQAGLDQFNAEASPDTRGVARKAFSAGIDGVQGSAAGAVAAYADVVGADNLKDRAMDSYIDNTHEAGVTSQGIVTNISDAESVGDYGEWALYNLVNQIPNLATMIGTGGIAGAAGKGAATLAAKNLLKDQIGKAAAKNIAGGMGKKKALEAATKQVTARSAKAGQIAGFSVPGIGLQAGEIQGSIYQETGETTHGGKALIAGAVGGLLESAPIFRLTKLAGIGGDVVREGIEANASKILKETGIQMGSEGATEAVQTVLQHAAVDWVDQNLDLFTEERLDEILNAAAAGALVGGVTGAGSTAIGQLRSNDDIPAEVDPEVPKLLDVDKKQLPKALTSDQQKSFEMVSKTRKQTIKDEAIYLAGQGDAKAVLLAKEEIRKVEARAEEIRALPEPEELADIVSDTDGPDIDLGLKEVKEAKTKIETDERPAITDGEVIYASNDKPWKSEKAALHALTRQKLEDTHKVAPQDGGYALLPAPEAKAQKLTEGQQKYIDRKKNARARVVKSREVDPDKDDILAAIAKIGGIDTDIENDLKGRLPKLPKQFGMPNLERPGKGLTLDHIGESLLDMGYLEDTGIGNGVDSNQTLDLIEKALAGTSVRSNLMDPEQFNAEQQQDADDQAQAELEREIEDIDYFFDRNPDLEASYLDAEARETLPDEYYAAEIADDDRALTELSEELIGLGIDPDKLTDLIDSRADAGESSQTIMRDLFQYAKEVKREKEAERGSQESVSAPEEENVLTSYTQEEVTEREQAQAKQQKAEADAVKKAEIAKTADDFVLSGSNSEADQAAARGQKDLLAQPTPESIDTAANEAATSDTNDKPKPTEAQKEAGNYALGHLELHGLDLSIENPKGSKREGQDSSGKKWSVDMKHHYGYVKNSEAIDGDHVDVFLTDKANDPTMPVFVVDQVNPETGLYDEPKVIIGSRTKAGARQVYKANYAKGWKGEGDITKMSMDEFKEWVHSDAAKLPLSSKVFRAEDAVPQSEAKPAPKKKAPAKKPAKGQDNKVFTSDAAEKARELLKKKLGNINSGLDPETIQAGITLAGFHIEAGARSFKDYTAAMVEDLGDAVQPYLRSWYESIRYYPEFDATGMSTAQEIDIPAAVEAKPEPVQSEPASTVDQAIDQQFDSIKNNRDMKRVIAEVEGVKAADVSMEQMKAAQEHYESVVAVKAREIVATKGDSKQTYDKLVDLYKSMPNLNVRSGDSMARMAYSTPAPFAYITSLIGGLTPYGKTWDNSSGHGMLLLRTNADAAVPNELDSKRYQSLVDMGFDGATNVNALEAPTDKQYQHVIANPPFGKMDGDYEADGVKLTTIDHALVAQALGSMTDDGTASFIIGANRKVGGETAADKRFFNWLYSNYRVVDQVEVDGKLYTKQGASWPLRMITIRGREKTDKIGPKDGAIKRLDSWDQLYEHYETVNGALADGGVQLSDGLSQRQDKQAADRFRQLRDGNSAKTSKPDGRDESGRAGERTSVSGNQHVEAVGTASRPDGNVDGDNRPDGARDTGASPAVEASNTKRSEGDASGRAKPDGDSRADELTDDLQTPYESASGLSSLGALVPSNMREPLGQFYDTMRSDIGDIDTFVKDKLGYTDQEQYKSAFMGLQVDAIAAAIYNYDQNNQGVIIADQTGIGKGRQAAAMIRYARRIGKVPIFVSVKPNLFTDMYDDLHDIGETDVVPFIMNASEGIVKDDQNGNKKMLHKSQAGAKQKATFADIIKSGKLPGDANVMFATYSQITKENDQRKVFDKLADNAWLILDEAHNMAGEQFKVKKGGHKVMTGGGFINAMTEKAATTYLSATYAKRPDNMSAFTKTALSEAFDVKPDEDAGGGRFGDGGSNPFADAIAAGGAPLQTVIANELTRKGQLIRRERSFDGISIAAEFDNANADFHRQIADQLVLGLRAIKIADAAFHAAEVSDMKAEAKNANMDVSGAGNRAGSGVDHTSFSSVLHNYISQMLLGLKADYAADQAIELHKQGIKPVIALENTMESFISTNAETMPDGEEFDLDYRDVLQRALDRTRRISVKEGGESKPVDVPLSQLSPETQDLYAKASAEIQALDLSGIPLSPIDYMKNKMQQAGINVGEITGRSRILDYSSGETPILSRRSKEEKDNRRSTVDDFNNGKLDAMVLNVAGSTGLSIHNSTKFPLEEQKKRHMIVVQMPLDINVMMQMLGRINRTGQRTEADLLPSFSILGATIPAEKRPMATALNKLASLNANTSANTEGSTTFDAPNFFNVYGDEVVNGYLNENPDLAKRLDLDKDLKDDDSGGADGIAKKATGRLAAYATVDEQVEFYDTVESEYKDLIAYRDSIGDNKLKSLSLDLKAKILESSVIVEGEKGATNSAISGDAVAHKVVARQTRKPPDIKMVNTAIKKSLGKKSAEAYADKALSSVMSEADANKQREKVRSSLKELAGLIGSQPSREAIKARMASLGDNATDKMIVAHKAFTKLDGARESRIADSRQSIQRFMEAYPIGKPVKLDMIEGGEPEIGIITGYEVKDSAKGNPLSSSKVKFEIMLASPTGKVKLPASKLFGGGSSKSSVGAGGRPMMTGADSSLTVEDMFGAAKKTNATENRVIVTGNLLAGIARVQKGQITTFTDSKGQMHTGLLLPRNYSGGFDRISATSFAVTSSEAGIKMLNSGTVTELSTDNGDVKLKVGKNAGSFSFELAKSGSSLASAIRTNKKYKYFGSDFYTVPGQNYYSMRVNGSVLAKRLIDTLNESGVQLAMPESMRDQYVEAGGQAKAKAGDFANTRKLPKKKTKKDDVQLRRTPGKSKGVRAAQARRVANRISNRWKNGPRIVVVDSISEIEGMPYDDDQIRGVYRHSEKTVYIIAGANPDLKAVEETLLHEVQHFAAREKYGKDTAAKLRTVGQLIEEMGGINEYVKKHGIDYDYSWYDQQFEAAGLSESARLANHVDELLAIMAGDKSKGAGKLRAAAQSAITAIRKWLRSMGFQLTAALPNDQLVSMLNETQKIVTGKSEPATRPIRSRAVNAHRVWHGSPHKFDKFSSDSIGTGEGAQAFGYGLYFADSKKLAEYYRDTLTNQSNNLSEIVDSIIESKGMEPLSSKDRTRVVTAMSEIKYKRIDQSLGGKYLTNISASLREKITTEQAQSIIDEAISKINEGNLYQVDLAPKQSDYILWDSSLKEQSDTVKEAMDDPIFDSVNLPYTDYEMNTGKEFYQGLYASVQYGEWDKYIDYLGVDSDSMKDAHEVAAAVLLKAGIRGNKYLDGDSRSSEKGKSFNYVIFDDKDVMIEDAFNRPGSKPDSSNFAVPDETLKDVAIRKMMDKHRVLKDVISNITNAGGKVDESNDAYLAEELFHGKAENDLRQMRENYVEPLAEKLAAFGITQAKLDEYLYAKHAAERNEHIASINPDMQEGGSGMTDQEAEAILGSVPRDMQAKYDEVAGIVYDMIASQRDLIREAGLEDDSLIDAWESKYKNYVPLKGFAADDAQEDRPGTGKGFAIGGKESKRALGRKSQAASPSSYAINDLTEKLVRKRKNEVGNAFLKLVEDNPNSDYWDVFTDDNPDTDRRIVKTKEGEEVREMPIPMAMMGDKYFTTKRDGKTYYIKLEDERLMRSMKNVGPETNNFLIRAMSSYVRVLSSLNTSYNPEFVVSNFARDIQTAALNLSAEQSRDDGKALGEKIVAQTLKDVPKAMRGVYRHMRGKSDTNGWGEIYEDFMDAGGKTGWFDMKDIDGQSKDLEKMIAMANGTAKGRAQKYFKASGDFVEHLNGSVENSVRLAAYKNAIDAGISREKAASLAKNMTVNFNRKGEVGTTLNALYMFANASIQGTANFTRTMIGFNGDGKARWRNMNNAQKMAVGIVAGSYMIGMANRFGAGEDDDGENWYDKVPDYVKERNIVIMKSLFGGESDGSYWKIPLPYGYNVFSVLGTSAEGVLSGSKSIGQGATDLGLATVGSFSPIGFSDSESAAGILLKNATPTFMKPIVDVSMNENFFGSTIYKENFPFGAQKPDSSLSRRNTPEHFKQLAEWMNKSTGGSAYRSGAIDINPDVMNYFVENLGGAAYGFWLGKVPDFAERKVDGRETELHRTPFLGRVNGQVTPYADQNKFYDRRNLIEQANAEAKNTTGTDRASFMRDFGWQVAMRPEVKKVEKQLKLLRKRRDEIHQSNLTPRIKDERLKFVEGRMKTVIDRFNKAYHENEEAN